MIHYLQVEFAVMFFVSSLLYLLFTSETHSLIGRRLYHGNDDNQHFYNHHHRNHGGSILEQLYQERNVKCYSFANHSTRSSNTNKIDKTKRFIMNIRYLYELEYSEKDDPLFIVREMKQSIGNTVGISIATNGCDKGKGHQVGSIGLDFESLDTIQGLSSHYSIFLFKLYGNSNDLITLLIIFAQITNYNQTPTPPPQEPILCELISTAPLNKCNVFLGTMTLIFSYNHNETEIKSNVFNDTKFSTLTIIKNIMDRGDLMSKYEEVIDVKYAGEAGVGSRYNQTEEEVPVKEIGNEEESLNIQTTTKQDQFSLLGKTLIGATATIVISGVIFATIQKLRQSRFAVGDEEGSSSESDMMT